MIKKILEILKEEMAKEKKMKQLIKAPFDYTFLQSLLNNLKQDTEIEIIKLNGDRLILRKLKTQKKDELDYFKC